MRQNRWVAAIVLLVVVQMEPIVLYAHLVTVVDFLLEMQVEHALIARKGGARMVLRIQFVVSQLFLGSSCKLRFLV